MPTVSPSYAKARAALFSGLLLATGVTAQTNPSVEVTAPKPVMEIPITGFVVNVQEEMESSNPQRYIKGVVMDGEYNEPLIGANILISNTNIGTVTDMDGRFELLISEEYTDQIENVSIEVSYIGYETQFLNEGSFSENMVINLPIGDVIMGAMVIEIPYQDQTLWQSGRRLWNRLQYNNPIRNWIENRQAKKTQEKEDQLITEVDFPTTDILDNDLDKKEKVVIQTRDNAAFNLTKVSPNPFQSFIHLNLEMMDAGKLTISLFTEDGKRVFDRSDTLSEGEQNLHLDVSASNLVPGTYILNLFDENGFQKSEVLILQ